MLFIYFLFIFYLRSCSDTFFCILYTSLVKKHALYLISVIFHDVRSGGIRSFLSVDNELLNLYPYMGILHNDGLGINSVVPERRGSNFNRIIFELIPKKNSRYTRCEIAFQSGQHWFRLWLVAYLAPSHNPNQCWVIVSWTFRNKLQWNFDQNTKLFIHQNASENIVCEMAVILSRGIWVKFSL